MVRFLNASKRSASFFAFFIFTTLSFSSLASAGESGRSLRVTAQLNWQKSCLKSLQLQFSSPVYGHSFEGKLLAKSKFVSEEVLVSQFSQDYKSLNAKFVNTHLCQSRFKPETLVVKAGIRDAAGLYSHKDLTIPLVGAKGNLSQLNFNIELGTTYNGRSETPVERGYECRPSATGDCLENLNVTSRVSIDKLNRAFSTVRTWEASERSNPIYNTRALHLLNLSDSILTSRGETNRKNHYGLPRVHYILRRAAKFISTVFPNTREIGVADISTKSGQTPHVTWPDGEIQYLHPKESHVGDDVDIGYITVGAGNDRKGAQDLEKNFWLLFSILQSTGVDLVYTSHKEALLAYAEDAYERGLINDIAFGVLKSAKVIQNDELNHNTHMHIKIANHGNRGITRTFLPSDNVYNCMIDLCPERSGSERNFCVKDL